MKSSESTSSVGDARRLQLLIDAVVDYAIYMIDLEGRVLSWNSGAVRLKGYSAGEIIGRNFSEFYADSDRAAGLPQTALATANHFRKPGTPAIVPADVGSTDANNAVAMGIPAVAIGAVLEHGAHRLEETAEASSIVAGVKSLIALAVALTGK